MRALSLLLAALWIGAAGPCPMGPGVPCPSGRQVTLGLTGGLPAGSTFTRAGNTATTLVNGVVTSVVANVARFPTDVNGKPQGYLNEPTVTELVTYSVPTTGQWNAVNTVNTYNASTAPDGTTTAATIADNTSNLQHYTSPTANVSVVSGTTYTSFAFVKVGTATVAQLAGTTAAFGTNAWATFNLATGQVAQTGSAATSYPPTLLSNGYYLIAVTAPAVLTTTGNFVVALTNNSTAAVRLPAYIGSGQSFTVWGLNIRVETAPTSYIATAGASATRNPDNLSVALSAYPWLQTAMGYSFATRFTLLGASQNGAVVFDFGDGTANNRVYGSLNASGQLIVTSVIGGASVSSSAQSLSVVGTPNTVAVSVSEAGATFSINRAAPVTVVNAGLAKATVGAVGRSSASAANYSALHDTALTLRQGPSSAAWLQGGNY